MSPWLSLFASTGTLLCCALPSLLVVLGMGATLVGFIDVFPQIIWVSQYKAYVFTLSALMIAAAGLVHYLNRNAPCPIDPQLAKVCMRTRKWSLIILMLSGFLWSLGAFFAFVAPLIMS